MARPRNFAEDAVLAQAADLFARMGYHGSSIDDLLTATGLQRGSLYKAFGSKRNLFEKVLARALGPGWTDKPASVDLLVIALKELVREDAPIATLCRLALEESGPGTAQLLGARLLEHLD